MSQKYLLTLDTNDILCLFYLNFCANEITFNTINRTYVDLKYYSIGAEI